MAKKNEDSLTIDERMDMLDDIIMKMESSEISLEDSFNYYKKGVELISSCNKAIDRVEKEVLKLSDDGSTEVFEEPEEQ